MIELFERKWDSDDYTFRIKYEVDYNRDNIYENKIYTTMKPTKFKWYHFVLFPWGLSKLYVDFWKILFFGGKDRLSKQVICPPKFLLQAIPKYQFKAIPTSESSYEKIELKSYQILILDTDEDSIMMKVPFEEEKVDGEWIVEKWGYYWTFNIRKVYRVFGEAIIALTGQSFLMEDLYGMLEGKEYVASFSIKSGKVVDNFGREVHKIRVKSGFLPI